MTTILGPELVAGVVATAGWGPGGGPGWGPGGWWPLVPVLWALFWVAVIVTAVLLWRRGFGSTRSAQSVLAERFARGDMTEQEYTERLAVLRRARRRAT